MITLGTVWNVAVVGSINDDCDDGADCGSAYCLKSKETLGLKLARSNDQFSKSIAIENDIIVVGSPLAQCDPDRCGGCNNGNSNCGAVYSYHNSGGWTLQTKITNCDQDNLDKFGSSVSL